MTSLVGLPLVIWTSNVRQESSIAPQCDRVRMSRLISHSCAIRRKVACPRLYETCRRTLSSMPRKRYFTTKILPLLPYYEHAHDFVDIFQ